MVLKNLEIKSFLKIIFEKIMIIEELIHITFIKLTLVGRSRGY